MAVILKLWGRCGVGGDDSFAGGTTHKHFSIVNSHSDRERERERESVCKWTNTLQGRKEEQATRQIQIRRSDVDQPRKPKSRKYEDAYLTLGFTMNVGGDEERPVCVLCLKTLAAVRMNPNNNTVIILSSSKMTCSFLLPKACLLFSLAQIELVVIVIILKR